MQLHQLGPKQGSKKKEKRIGRGPGSGHGKTATKGHKGHLARSDGGKGRGFEGGQMPMTRRVLLKDMKPWVKKARAGLEFSLSIRVRINRL